MKKPDGNIDLVGTGMQLGLGIVDLIKEFAPSADVREQNRKNRKIRTAIRRLKHKFRETPVDLYVKVNFSNYSLPEQQEITEYIQSQLKQ